MDLGSLLRIGLLLARPGMLVMSSPMFGGHFAPPHVRIGLTVLISIILMPVVQIPPVVTLSGILVVVLRELAIGLALGLALRTIVAGAELGGHLAGSQLMLSYGSTIDPQGGVRNNVTSNLYGNLALLTLFAINGHHAFLRALASSYAQVPIGFGGVDGSLVRGVMGAFGVIFVLGVQLAAPVVVVMLVMEIGLGLVNMAAPSLNLMAVGPPLRIVVGLLALAAVVPLVPAVVTRFASAASAIGMQMATAFR